MAYNEYNKVPLLQLVPRSYLETPPADTDMVDDTSDPPFVTKFYMAQAAARTELFIPMRYRFAGPDASIGGVVSISQAASSTETYAPTVPVEASTYALNDSHVEQDELAVTECTTLTFSVTLNGSKQLSATSGTIGGTSDVLTIASPKPFHKFSRELKEFATVNVSSSNLEVTLASGDAGPRTSSWANFSITWDEKYDYYVYATADTVISPGLVGINCATYPNITNEFSLSFELEDSDSFAFWDYSYVKHAEETFGLTTDVTTSDSYRTHYGFYGPLTFGTAGSTIRARMTGSSCTGTGSFGGKIALTLIRVPKGATTTTYNLSTSVSLSAAEASACDNPFPGTDTDNDTATDTVNIPETSIARNVRIYYYIDAYTSDTYAERYCPLYTDSDAGASAYPTLVKSGDDYTLSLIGASLARKGEAQVASAASATILVISYPEGQALVAAPGLKYYGS